MKYKKITVIEALIDMIVDLGIFYSLIMLHINFASCAFC